MKLQYCTTVNNIYERNTASKYKIIIGQCSKELREGKGPILTAFVNPEMKDVVSVSIFHEYRRWFLLDKVTRAKVELADAPLKAGVYKKKKKIVFRYRNKCSIRTSPDRTIETF